ncbi:unnamed protein product [Chironomus riparius]|uniref:Uncharacterized protein n=1 Tax=Chironomus riparius TaxID=315576 RepID=A0A9P0IQ69_9DIPT|nr:unnamed protein product [Chironomus riparius]
MMKEILLIICILASIKPSKSLIIECSFIKHTYSHLKDVSCCHVVNNLNIITQEKAIVTSNTNDSIRTDTVGFRIFNISTRYFPQGLDRMFNNLKVIEISFGQLKEIHQTDLKPFMLLEVIYFYSNDIEVLESGLFDDNKSLRYILFTKNKLAHIDGNVFEKLLHLTNLYLNGNECIDKFTEINSTALQQIRKTIKNQCQNAEFISINRNLTILEEKAGNLKIEEYPAFYKNLTNLEDSRFFQYSTIKKRTKALINWNILMLWNNVIKLNDLIAKNNTTVIERLNEMKDSQYFYEHNITKVIEQAKAKQFIVQNKSLHLEETSILEELRLNLSKITVVQNRQVLKGTISSFTWEPFWIGVCSVLVLILIIVLIKNYVAHDQIFSYSISEFKRYNHEGNRVSYL